MNFALLKKMSIAKNV